MICQRCLRLLRAGEGLKCDGCESKFHWKCVTESPRDLREGGDRIYQWKCAVCHKSTSRTNIQNTTSKDDLLNAISIITEKFELVNKVQLPKLNSDLMQVKSITEQIVRQNEDILQRIGEIENRKKNEEKINCCSTSHSCFRKRNLNISSKSKANAEDGNYVPLLPMADKNICYKTRRPYLLRRMLRIFHRKLSNRRSRSPRVRK